MSFSRIKAVIPCNISTVWNVVTDVKNYGWRSDLNKTEVINENQFVEYSKTGFSTVFSITAVDKYKRWEFDMDNRNMSGHWIGLFKANGDETELDFSECVNAKKFLLKPFVKMYLRKQQSLFISDLKKAILK